jgi:HEAT repeat protein
MIAHNKIIFGKVSRQSILEYAPITATMISRMFLSISLLLPLMFSACAESRTALARKYLSQEKNDAIRAAAMEYLKDCKKPECNKLVIAALHDASGAIRYKAISSLDPSVDRIGLFIESLKDPDDRVWLCAVNSLLKIGAPALEALKIAASDKDPFVREGAIIVLGKTGGARQWNPFSKEWIPPPHENKRTLNQEIGDILVRALRDDDINVRRDATEIFAFIDSPEAVDALLKNAEDPEPGVKAAAFRSLNGYSDSRIISSAFRALRDPQPEIRQAAAHLLRSQLTTAHAEKIYVLLNDRNPQMRCLAFSLATSLPDEQLNPRFMDALRAHRADYVSCKETPIAIQSSKAIKVLFDIADASNDNAFVIDLSQRLPYSNDPTVTSIYLNALRNSRHALIRRVAVERLSRSFEGKTNLKLLAPFYKDNDSVVRFWAASFGASTGDEKAVPILEQFTNNPYSDIQSMAIARIANFMPTTFDYLSSLLLRNSEILDAQNIATILQALKSSERKAELLSVLMAAFQSKNPDVVRNALAVLYNVDEKAARLQLEKLLRNDNQQIRIAAIKGIQSEDWEMKKGLRKSSSEDLEINKILFGVIAEEKEPEKIRISALNAFDHHSDITKSFGIKDTLYSILKKKSSPLKLRLALVGTLGDHDNPGKIIKDMLNDPDVCDLVSQDACELALHFESPNDVRNGIMQLSDLNIEKLPSNCRTSIARNLSKIRETRDPYAIEKLQEMGRDNDPAIRAAVATALGEISSSVTLPFLNKLTQDSDPGVREKAGAAVRMIENHLLRKAD